MPRRAKPIRLYLRPSRSDRGPVWVIVDKAREVSTGASAGERCKAEAALAAYIAARHRPSAGVSRPDQLSVAEVMQPYLDGYAPSSPSARWIGVMSTPILRFWGQMPLSAVRGETCRRYRDWRLAQRAPTSKRATISIATVRHELSVLLAGIRHYAREHGLSSLPIVTLPPVPPPKDVFWRRQMAAERLRAARHRPETRHIAKLIVLGLYSGSRVQTMLRLRWMPSVDACWVDVDKGLIYRRGSGTGESRKRQPACRIHQRLLPHLRRWREKDSANGVTHVINYNGRAIRDCYGAWNVVRIATGHEPDGPHVLRHSAATLFVEAGLELQEISSFLGMSVATLTKVYWHRSPRFQANIAATTPGKRPGLK
jgi:integrase